MTVPRSCYLDLGLPGPVPGSWDGLRVGSETCSVLVPDSGVMGALESERGAGTLSLVTPVAGPDEFPAVLEAAESAIARGWGEVVVNDWGVLSELTRHGGTGITAGRLLMRFRRGPGAFKPWDDPDPSTRRYFAWGPLFDSPFLAFLRERGVDRIEIDPPRRWLPLPEPEGLLFSLHRDTRLISVTAACPRLYDTERGSWSPVSKCGAPCAFHRDIVMSSPALETPLFLRGRAILERVETDIPALDLPGSVDRIVCDRPVITS